MSDEQVKSVELDRGSLATLEASAKEKMRYSLNGICVTREETVATNGRILIRTAHPEPIGIASKVGQGEGEFPEAGMMLRLEVAKGLLRNLDKGKRLRRKPQSRILMSEDPATRNPVLNLPAGTDGVSRVDEIPMPLEGTFPTWTEVMPADADSCVTLSVDPDELLKIIKTEKAINSASDRDQLARRIQIRVPVESKWKFSEAKGKHYAITPIRIDGAGGRMNAVIMPCTVS